MPVGSSIPESLRAEVHGRMFPSLNVSHGHFDDINLLGSNFFFHSQATLVVDYKRLKVSISATQD